MDLEKKGYSIDRVNLEGLSELEKGFIEKLNTSLYYGNKDPKESIMHYEQLCSCDDGFLCEHRLQLIIDWIKNK